MLAIIVLAHQEPEQLASLLSLLLHQNIRTYVHVDSAAEPVRFRSAVQSTGVGDVTWLPSRRTRWGGIEVIDVELDAMKRAAEDGADYLILISGQDVPLQSADALVEFTAAHRSETFIEYFHLPYSHWPFDGRSRTDFYAYTLLNRREVCIPRGEDMSTFNLMGQLVNTTLRLRSAFKPPRRFPSYLTACGGQHWLNLSREALDFILTFVQDHPDYRRYHEYTINPDEIFFQSIVLGANSSVSRSVINDDLRFMVWPDRSDNHPRELIMADLPDILASHDLFARKVSATRQPELFAALQEHVAA